MIRIYAWELQAGDLLVVKQGSIRKSFHICEVATINSAVHVVYNGARREFVKETFDINDVVRIRE